MTDPGPWPFPKSPPECNETFEDILEWTPEEEEAFMKIIDQKTIGDNLT